MNWGTRSNWARALRPPSGPSWPNRRHRHDARPPHPRARARDTFMYKILVADPISESGLTVFQNRNGHFKIDARSKLSAEELKKAVVDADAIIVRSETKITSEI